MYLEQIKLRGWRNLVSLEMAFSPNVNIFLGQNAQGKTNLLESIYFLAITRSHRSNNDKELINFESDFASLEGKVHKSQVDVDLRIVISKQGKKTWVNHKQQKKLSAYLGQMNTILFSPEDLSLVKGAPALRRRFMDLEFGQIDAQYLFYASQYKQVLTQKNNYLKQLSMHQAQDQMFLSVLSDQLAGIAAEIVSKRKLYLDKLSEYAGKAYEQISSGNETLSLVYRSSGVSDVQQSAEDLYMDLKAGYEQNQAAEIRKGTTLAGPHRDDIQFLLDGKDAHLYASQGQQRTIALSIKLAEISLIHELTSEYPILLLDDVMSELDTARQEALLNYIHGKTQTFITTTDLDGISWEIIKQPQIYRVEAGNVSKEEE